MRYFLLISFLLSLGAFKATGQDSTSQWNVYEKPAYLIKYPPSWKLGFEVKPPVQFFLIDTLQIALLRTSVNLVIEDSRGINLDEYVKVSVGQIKEMVKDVKILRNERHNTPSTNYHQVIYATRQYGPALEIEQRYYIQKTKAYVLTLTYAAGDTSTYKKAGELILANFRLKK
ncbi:hypothetical protein BKI52_19645 [marine bacterium AO1-C]|nr:hypothetical protein BKI52_19645 [marine bacterium AO1-C]